MSNQNGPHQVSFVPLKFARKRRLVEMFTVEGYTCDSVATCYKIHPERLRHYSKRLRKHLPLFELGGRPPKLDVDSVEVILSNMRANPTMNKIEVHRLIRAENKKTFVRRYPDISLNDRKAKISQLSVRRWTEKLLQMV